MQTFTMQMRYEKDEPIQIIELKEVITNSLVNTLLDNDIKDKVVTFLKYQKFGTYVKQDEVKLLKEVNEILQERS